MKNILISFIGILCLWCCQSKPAQVNYVINDSLERRYQEDVNLDFFPKDWDRSEVSSAQMAFDILEPIFISCFGKEEVDRQKPFSIRLLDDEVWIVEGALNLPGSGIVSQGVTQVEEMVFQGTTYAEIRKSDGKVLKIIMDE